MILEWSIIGMTGLYFKHKHNKKYRQENEIRSKWILTMYHTGAYNKTESKDSDDKQTFEILKYIKKEYGYDLVVSIPYGLTYFDLLKIKPQVETGLCASVKMDYVKESRSAYVRVYENLMDEKLRITNDWNNIMESANIKNHLGETYEVEDIELKEEYGYDMIVSIPKGLTYEKIEENDKMLEANLNSVIEMNWNRYKGNVKIRVASKEFDENEKFIPVDTKPYELYLSKTFFRDNVISDMRDYPHVLISGATGTGKSRALFIPIVNLINRFDENTIGLWLAQVSDKKDIEKFARCKHTRYFAYHLDKAYEMLLHIRKILKEKNRTLSKYLLDNIDDYNKKFPDNKWDYNYIIFDEFASFMPDENKEIDPYYNLKKKILVELYHVIKESRSCGFYIISAIQRPDKENMPPIFKSQFNTKQSFRQNNLASAKVVTDDGAVLKLPNREALFETSERFKTKTLYIDNAIIHKYIKHSLVNKPNYVDLNCKDVEINENNKQSDDNKKSRNKSVIDMKVNNKQGVVNDDIKL